MQHNSLQGMEILSINQARGSASMMAISVEESSSWVRHKEVAGGVAAPQKRSPALIVSTLLAVNTMQWGGRSTGNAQILFSTLPTIRILRAPLLQLRLVNRSCLNGLDNRCCSDLGTRVSTAILA